MRLIDEQHLILQPSCSKKSAMESCSQIPSIRASDLALTSSDNERSPTLHISPAIGDECRRLLDMSNSCFEMLRCCGSPLNILLPERIDNNTNQLHETFKHYHITGKIFCSTKPNRSIAALRHIAHRQDLGVDVSSEGSLIAALSAGVSSQRLEATGPKSKKYLTLALLHGITVNVDDIGELEQIFSIRRALTLVQKTPIVVRLSGFTSSHVEGDGTFGVTIRDLPLLFSTLEKHKIEIDLRGFAYHLNTTSIPHRVAAMEQCISAIFEGRRRGFSPNVINLGGGFRIRYAQDDQEWSQFLVQLKSSLLDAGQACTWNRNGLGFTLDGRVIKGAARFMEHTEPLPPSDQLCNLLRQPLPSYSGISAAQLISEALLEVWIEPGRAIFDQVGLTLGQVVNVRQTEFGEPLLVMEMNRSNLNSFELSLLTDPIHIPLSRRGKISPIGYFITGNLCVSNELLTPRKVFFNQQVTPGDILAFCNTAPYIMDFAESRTLHQPLARKVACYFENNRLQWSLDEEYQPQARNVEGEAV